MANPYIASNLEADIKRRCFLGVNDSTSEADLLGWLTSEVQSYIASILISVRQEYLTATQDIAFTGTQTSVQIPVRATAQGLRTVKLLDSTDNARELKYIEPERTQHYGPTGSTLCGYSLQGQHMVLVPPGASGTLRVSFVQRPSRIVSSDSVAQVSSINTGTKAVTCSTVPSTWTSTNTFDTCSQQAGFQNWSIDQAATIAGSVLTFANTLPTDLAVGDYVCLAGESPGPQIPLELYPLLCQRVAVKLAEAQMSPRLADVVKMLDTQKEEALVLLAPRVKDAVKRIIRKDSLGRHRYGGY